MDEIELRMHRLRERFVARSADDRRRLAAAIEAGDRAAMRGIAHALAGSGGIFGFPAVSDAGRNLEDALDAGADPEALRCLGMALMGVLPSADQED